MFSGNLPNGQTAAIRARSRPCFDNSISQNSRHASIGHRTAVDNRADPSGCRAALRKSRNREKGEIAKLRIGKRLSARREQGWAAYTFLAEFRHFPDSLLRESWNASKARDLLDQGHDALALLLHDRQTGDGVARQALIVRQQLALFVDIDQDDCVDRCLCLGLERRHQVR